jgi:hypothetical protein
MQWLVAVQWLVAMQWLVSVQNLVGDHAGVPVAVTGSVFFYIRRLFRVPLAKAAEQLVSCAALLCKLCCWREHTRARQSGFLLITLL